MSESLMNPMQSHRGETAFPVHQEHTPALSSAANESPVPPKDHYQVFAEELAHNNRNLHARIAYSIHWLYRETKVGR